MGKIASLILLFSPAGRMCGEEFEVVCVRSFAHSQDMKVLLTDPGYLNNRICHHSNQKSEQFYFKFEGIVYLISQ